LEGTEKLEIFLIFTFILAILNNIFNSRLVDSIFQQCLIVVEQFRDCLLCVHSVVLVSLHALGEEVRDPLSNIQLILLVSFSTELKYFIYKPTYTDHR
jgi:hypothetical protein